MTKNRKRYGVDFYDMIDGWIRLPDFDPDMQFDDLENAIKVCKSKQAMLADGNISCGEHYSVIDFDTGMEVYCLRNHRPTPPRTMLNDPATNAVSRAWLRALLRWLAGEGEGDGG